MTTNYYNQAEFEIFKFKKYCQSDIKYQILKKNQSKVGVRVLFLQFLFLLFEFFPYLKALYLFYWTITLNDRDEKYSWLVYILDNICLAHAFTKTPWKIG